MRKKNTKILGNSTRESKVAVSVNFYFRDFSAKKEAIPFNSAKKGKVLPEIGFEILICCFKVFLWVQGTRYSEWLNFTKFAKKSGAQRKSRSLSKKTAKLNLCNKGSEPWRLLLWVNFRNRNAQSLATCWAFTRTTWNHDGRIPKIGNFFLEAERKKEERATL